MSTLHVIFKVGDAEYAIAASDVVQMESFSGATHVPGSAAYVAGIIQVRGRVVPVVDLRARFGLDPIAATLDSRVVVVQHGERTVGLLADSAREVIKLGDEQIQAPPRMLGDGSSGYVKAVAHAGKRILMMIDIVQVIGEESHHVR